MMKTFGLPVLVTLIALSSVFAPGLFRIVLYIFGFVVFCYLCMALKEGEEAKAELRRLKG